MSKWSYRKLVREYGEERALEILQEQKGNGEFSHSHNDSVDTPWNEVHDEINPVVNGRNLRPIPITQVKEDVGWTPIKPKKQVKDT